MNNVIPEESTLNYKFKKFIGRIKNVVIGTKNLGVYLAFILISILFSFMSPYFLTLNNIRNILIQNADMVILAMGQTFVILTGGIDLSVGSIIVVVSYVVAIMLASGLGVFLSIIGGLIVGAFMGFINGLVVAKGKVTPFIATFGMMTVGRGLVYVYSQGVPISNLNKPTFRWIANGRLGFMPAPIIWVILVGIISYVLLKKMKIGRHIYAVGSNAEAAKLAGVNIDRVLMFVYTMSGLLAAISGIILTSRLSSANASLGDGMELSSIAAVVLGGTSLMGGTGGVIGSIIGSYLMAILYNGFVLLGINPYWQIVVTGFIIVVAVMFDRFRNKSSS